MLEIIEPIKRIDKRTLREYKIAKNSLSFCIVSYPISYGFETGFGHRGQKPSNYKLKNSRINNKWPVAKEGIPFIAISGALTLLFVFTGLFFVSILAGMVLLFIIFFFRDPKRSPISDAGNAVLTPADGTILEVLHLKNTDNPLGQASIKISIFMSVFNVHVNRIPIKGTIEKITYHPGKFFSANLDKASKQNERNEITLQTPDGKKIVFIQIAGLIARRIACWIENGDRVLAAQRFGLIRFGSRLEVFLPEGTETTIQVAEKVKAGKTVIGYLQD